MIIEKVYKENDSTIHFFYDSRSFSEGEIKRYLKGTKCLLEPFTYLLRKELKIKEGFILNVNLCGDYKIRSLNKQYRGKDYITDVLSFPLQDSLREMPMIIPGEGVELGDLFICKSKILNQAKEFSLTPVEEYIHLAVHGFLHLCGYDHELSQKEEALMEGLEEKLIKKINL